MFLPKNRISKFQPIDLNFYNFRLLITKKQFKKFNNVVSSYNSWLIDLLENTYFVDKNYFKRL
jgi:hypothetical protein